MTLRSTLAARLHAAHAAHAGLAALATLLLATGCISVDLGGGGRGEMEETVVLGRSGPKVLLLDIDGEITDADASGVLGWVLAEGTVARVQDELDLAERKGDVAAILLRIDSPGGSPTASDAVHRQLVRFKQAHGIPVHAQLMSVAASGGYYVAMAADRVNASPTTVTGSIGVLMLGINLSGLMDKIGVENQTLTSGPFKDAGSFLRPMRPEERKQLQSVIDDLYARFVTVVDEGRPELSAERIRQLADGRVYSAEQAHAAGLVDGVADLEDTIDALRQQLGEKDVRVVSYHRPRDVPSNIFSRTTVKMPVELETGLSSRLLPRPGFYYLWWPGAQ
jgi:protease-4